MAADYATYAAAHSRHAAAVLADLDQLYDRTVKWAKQQTARAHAHPTPATRQAAADAWALVRSRRGGLDPLGEPVDPTHTGRAKFERAWLLRTGQTWTHPDHDDTTDEHAAGHHHDTTLRRSYAGDLPPCSACMDDDDWATERTHHRKATQ